MSRKVQSKGLHRYATKHIKRMEYGHPTYHKLPVDLAGSEATKRRRLFMITNVGKRARRAFW